MHIILEIGNAAIEQMNREIAGAGPATTETMVLLKSGLNMAGGLHLPVVREIEAFQEFLAEPGDISNLEVKAWIIRVRAAAPEDDEVAVAISNIFMVYLVNLFRMSGERSQ